MRTFLQMMSATLALLGVCALLYPTTQQWWEQHQENQALAHLSQETITQNDVVLAQLRDEARAYNKQLFYGMPLDQWDYHNLLRVAPSTVMGRVKVPTARIDQPLRHGMSEAVLSQGLGHLEGTSLPVGGPDTHAVIGGHRGLATAVGMTYLDQVAIGDEITLEIAGEALVYQVIFTEVRDPGTAEIQPIVKGKDLITLITCTPLGMNTHRIVVTAERKIPTPEEAVSALGATSDLPGFPWWAVVLAAAIVTYAVYGTHVVRGRRRSSSPAPLKSEEIPAS